MRRVGKFLLYLALGMAAAASAALATWIVVVIWVARGEKAYDEADEQRLAQMFVEATTLPDGRRIFLGSNARSHDLRFAQDGVNVGDSHPIRRATLQTWFELGSFGNVPDITVSHADEGKTYLVGFVETTAAIPSPAAADGDRVEIARNRCRIRLRYAADTSDILGAETVAAVGTLPPGWFRAAQPCIGRGLFATVGLVGESCVVRPSILCPLDAERRGTQADFVVLQALQHTRLLQRRGDASAGLADPRAIIRQVLAEGSDNDALFNLRRERLLKFFEQFEWGWYFMTASDEQLGGTPHAIRWRWVLNLRPV